MKDPFLRELWVSLSVIFISIIAAVVGLSLVLSDVSSRAKAIMSYQAMAALRSGNVGLLASLTKDAAAAAPYQSAINQLLPSEDALIQFPHIIQALGNTYHVNARTSFSGDPTAPSGGAAGFVPFSLTVSGQPSDVSAFLKNIETQSPQFFLTLSSIDFATSPDGTAQISATGHLFFQ